MAIKHRSNTTISCRRNSCFHLFLSLFLLNFYETCIEARWITIRPKNDKTSSKTGYRLYTYPHDCDNFSALHSDVVCWTDGRARSCDQTSFPRRIALSSAISFQGSATLQNVIEHFEPHLQTSPFPLLCFSTHLSELRVCDVVVQRVRTKRRRNERSLHCTFIRAHIY